MNIDNNIFGYKKQEKTTMKDFIQPSKQYSLEMKTISDKIDKKIEEIEKQQKIFMDAFNEIKGQANKGMSMDDIKKDWERKKQELEDKENENDIIDIFSKKLKALKNSLKSNDDDGGFL